MGIKKEELKEIEYCVSCGTATQYKKTYNVVFRNNYIEGAGQLCFKCAPKNLNTIGEQYEF